MRGRVNWFDRQFGFITPNGGGDDIFVHFKGIVSDEKYRKLDGGDHVEFDIEDSPKGPIAVNVKKVEA